MNDLKFDHTKRDIPESMGLSVYDVKRFLLDLEEYMHKHEYSHHTHALEFIWAADQSFEMKIFATFTLGGLVGIGGNFGPTIIQGKMSDLPPEIAKILKRLMDE